MLYKQRIVVCPEIHAKNRNFNVTVSRYITVSTVRLKVNPQLLRELQTCNVPSGSIQCRKLLDELRNH